MPKFHRPRSVPFALKEAVERKLDRLEIAGSLKRLDWTAPLVIVAKKDGIRCGSAETTRYQ